MSRFLRRLGVILIALVLLLGILLAAWTPSAVRSSYPQIEGQLATSGLVAPVEIYRDRYGIPHIYASSVQDLFFAQGYVHAQDRFWQMDFWRHQGAGRLSELLGDATLETDQFLKTLGWERIARQELAQLGAEQRLILEAYASGVNAYLASHSGKALSLEYAILPIINRSYVPQPWSPLNSMTWAKAMAWDLRGNMDTEIDQARLLKTLSPEQVAELFPPYPPDRPVIVKSAHPTTSGAHAPSSELTLAKAIAPALAEASATFARLDALGGGGRSGIGSNNWVIAGQHTATGMPYLANDPHLSAQMPSIWYEVGLHCVPLSADCPYKVTGFSFAGTPGVIIGHNDHLAWGMTNVGPDVMDLYLEKINPNNPNQYEYQGEWVDMQLIEEQIEIAGGETQPLTVRLTRHGPLITAVYGLEDFAQEAGIDLPEQYAIALRWTALEPSCVFCAIWQMNRAQDWEQFRTATRSLAVPSQNLVYADVEGNIGYQTPGNIPIRGEGHSGMLPVPGWTGEYEWQGYIPFEELPSSFNPPEGYIVTANNAVVDESYPYTISREWDYGLRAQRIVEMIENAPGPIDAAYIARMQGDNKELNAEILVPLLLQIPLQDERLENARQLFEGWDFQHDMESAPAALYAAFWKHLLLATFSDDLPEFFQPDTNSQWAEVMRRLVEDPAAGWWDDRHTDETESMEAIFRRAFAAAVDELDDKLGKDPARWKWGDLHTVTFENAVMSNIPLISRAFNRGPYRTAGGNPIVNATGWDLDPPYLVNWLPSMRMIVDLGDLQASLTMHTTGQSGHAYHPHYIDMADSWRQIEFHPMHWERSAIEGDAEGLLRLVP